jgi:ubiquinone/menaquinone biosynthesis C-methylase UbiE
MRPELQRRVQRYGWDYSSPHYHSGWQRQLWPAQEQLLDKTAIQPREDILDISCGTGLVTFPMAERVGPSGSIIGIDLSEGMIAKARAYNEDRDFSNITFRQMDAEELELSEDSFDVAVNSLGLMYYPHPEKAIHEMFRVLKPSGRASALVWGRRSECGWAEIFPIVDCRVKTDVCPLFFQLGTGENLSRAFRKAGFSEITSDRFTLSLQYETDEEAIIGAFLGGAVALAYRKFDEQTKQKAHEEYIQSIKAYEQEKGEGYSIPGEFVIVTGVKPGR